MFILRQPMQSDASEHSNCPVVSSGGICGFFAKTLQDQNCNKKDMY